MKTPTKSKMQRTERCIKQKNATYEKNATNGKIKRAKNATNRQMQQMEKMQETEKCNKRKNQQTKKCNKRKNATNGKMQQTAKCNKRKNATNGINATNDKDAIPSWILVALRCHELKHTTKLMNFVLKS